MAARQRQSDRETQAYRAQYINVFLVTGVQTVKPHRDRHRVSLLLGNGFNAIVRPKQLAARRLLDVARHTHRALPRTLELRVNQ